MGLSSDYEIPDGAKDMWKKFGTNTEAGKLLRSIYGNKLPTNINYPLPRQRRMTSFSEEQKTRWNGTTSVEEKPKPQPKGYVNVPKVGRGQPYVGPPRVYNLPFRKSLATIQRETKGFKTEKAPLMRPVRDRADMRDKLQDTFTYGGGNALPKGAMGNTIGMDPKQASKVPTRPRRPSTEIDPETGLDEEKYLIFNSKIKIRFSKRFRKLFVLEAVKF